MYTLSCIASCLFSFVFLLLLVYFPFLLTRTLPYIISSTLDGRILLHKVIRGTAVVDADEAASSQARRDDYEVYVAPADMESLTTAEQAMERAYAAANKV